MAPPAELTSPRFAGEPLLEACFANRGPDARGHRRRGTPSARSSRRWRTSAMRSAGSTVCSGPRPPPPYAAFKTHESLGSTQFGDRRTRPPCAGSTSSSRPTVPARRPRRRCAQKWPLEDRPTWNQVFENRAPGRGRARRPEATRANGRVWLADGRRCGDPAVPAARGRCSQDAESAVATDIEARQLLSIEYAPRSISGQRAPGMRWFDSALQTTCAQFKDPREPVRAAARARPTRRWASRGTSPRRSGGPTWTRQGSRRRPVTGGFT
jgi:hypothetical protein